MFLLLSNGNWHVLTGEMGSSLLGDISPRDEMSNEACNKGCSIVLGENTLVLIDKSMLYYCWN